MAMIRFDEMKKDVEKNRLPTITRKERMATDAALGVIETPDGLDVSLLENEGTQQEMSNVYANHIITEVNDYFGTSYATSNNSSDDPLAGMSVTDAGKIDMLATAFTGISLTKFSSYVSTAQDSFTFEGWVDNTKEERKAWTQKLFEPVYSQPKLTDLNEVIRRYEPGDLVIDPAKFRRDQDVQQFVLNHDQMTGSQLEQWLIKHDYAARRN
ncbi:MAG: hypothetical protein ABII01_07635 [Candidatus Woesearchaeota archaeon]